MASEAFAYQYLFCKLVCGHRLSLLDQAHLPGVGRGLGVGGLLQIVVIGVELSNELVEPQRGFPNIGQKATTRASASNRPAAVHRRIVALMLCATAIEFSAPYLHGVSEAITLAARTVAIQS